MKQTLSILTAVFAVLMFLVSCGGSEGSADGKPCESCGIYGHVTDYETGEDVANASVQLRPGGDTTLTGSDGMYEFRGLPSGDYSITVSKAGYSDLVDDFVITVRDRMVRRDIQIVNIPECNDGYFNGLECVEIKPCDKNNITPCIEEETGYMWSSRSKTDMDWDSAMAYCDNLSEGDFDDWSLPSKEVLANFYNGNGSSKLGDTGWFWSSTPYGSNYAYSVNFSNGDVSNYYNLKSYSYSVRCVRW